MIGMLLNVEHLRILKNITNYKESDERRNHSIPLNIYLKGKKTSTHGHKAW